MVALGPAHGRAGNQITRAATSNVCLRVNNSGISTYPAWTGIQNLPGYAWVPPAGDSARNGVYQDFGTYVCNYPTR